MEQNKPIESTKGGEADMATIPKTLGLRQLVGAAIVTPMVLAAGILWLHHLPTGTEPRSSDTVVEVRLIAQDPVDQKSESSAQMASHSQAVQPDTLVEDPLRSIPQDQKSVPEETRTEPAPSPQKKSEPSSPAARAAPTDKSALTFQRTLLSHIARYRLYPDDAKRNGVQGIVTVLFAMRRNGTVMDVWIRGTSGNKTLDAAAIDTIRRAVPLPNIPSEMPDTLNVLIPVAFNLP
jgi:protein TonB